MWKSLLVAWIVTAVAIAIAAAIVPSVEIDGGVLALLGVALLFGLVNALLGTLLRFLTLPINVITFGLFALVVNGCLLAAHRRIVRLAGGRRLPRGDHRRLPDLTAVHADVVRPDQGRREATRPDGRAVGSRVSLRSWHPVTVALVGVAIFVGDLAIAIAALGIIPGNRKPVHRHGLAAGDPDAARSSGSSSSCCFGRPRLET